MRNVAQLSHKASRADALVSPLLVFIAFFDNAASAVDAGVGVAHVSFTVGADVSLWTNTRSGRIFLTRSTIMAWVMIANQNICAKWSFVRGWTIALGSSLDFFANAIVFAGIWKAKIDIFTFFPFVSIFTNAFETALSLHAFSMMGTRVWFAEITPFACVPLKSSKALAFVTCSKLFTCPSVLTRIIIAK